MDKRKKKIIYLSHCLLNQNLRFPGIAVEKGPIIELINPIIKMGIGIELLPCLERLGWGGIRRQIFYKYLPKITNNIGKRKFPIIKFFLSIWLRNYRKLCRREAQKLVHQIQDYHNSGYSILGIITTNDSPTCGFTKTINLLELSSKFKELGLKNEFFENPKFEIMQNLIPNICENGIGIFTFELIRQIRKNKIDVKIIGFNIWNDLAEETERVLKSLEHST